MRMLRPLASVLLASTLLLVACDGNEGLQSALHPAGAGAREATRLWWLTFWLATLVFISVLALMLWGFLRNRGGRQEKPARTSLWIGLGGFLIPLLILGVVLGWTLDSMRVHSQIESGGADITVKVVGHQWWWEIEYVDEAPQRRLTTANEIVIPAGEVVKLELESRDVIHSFWVPNLQHKTDLIPGRTTSSWIQADEPGIHRGQCAEFCGTQHSNMGIVVIALERAEYDAWYEAQLQPAAEPADQLAADGQRVFMQRACSMCHAIRGTMALASFGPDLTHLASRSTIAAGTLPNTRGHLAGWISDPQGIKPGNRMPNIDMTGSELLALLAYLEGLY